MASSTTPINVEDGYAEYESAPKRQRTTSKVWNEMTKVECNDKELLKAQCNHCKTILSAKSTSGTSHLRRYLEGCLKKYNKSIRQYTISTQSTLSGGYGSLIKNYNYNQEECRRAISVFLVCGKHSFRTVEEPGFKHLMSIACPNYKNISRQTATRDVMQYYTKERELVKEELAKAPGRICLTSDNWKSEHSVDEYICLTAHWIDSDWKLQKRIIRFRALTPPYDGLNIADEIFLCLDQWKIDRKIFSITLDNASYNDVMVSSLKSRFRANKALVCDGANFQIRCCAHILNLIVQAGLKLIDDVICKVRNGIKYIKRSGPRKKIFYEIAEKSFHLNGTKKLHQDVCIRWNSTYLMLECFLYYKDVFDYWGHRDKDFLFFALTDEEFRNVQILCKFLKVFYDVTCMFSGSKYPTSNIYFRGVWKVHNILLDTVKGPHTFLSPMVKEMQEKFNKYWAEYSVVLSCAAIFDPRYKLKYVQYCYTKLYGNHASDFVQTILNTLRILLDEYLKNFKLNSSSLDESSTVMGANVECNMQNSNGVGAAFDSCDEAEDYKEFLSRSKSGIERSQLDLYLDEKELDLNSEIDIMEYWSKSSIRYSELSLLARDLLAIPISTVASESAFSIGKKVINYMRSSLKPKTVQAVVCLDDWMRAKGFSLELEDEASGSSDDENDGENDDATMGITL